MAGARAAVAKAIRALRDEAAGRERRQLAPLEPEAFLAWAVEDGKSPNTVASLAFDFHMPEAEVRRMYVHLAAHVRRNQRLGLDPWEGLRR